MWPFSRRSAPTKEIQLKSPGPKPGEIMMAEATMRAVAIKFHFFYFFNETVLKLPEHRKLRSATWGFATGLFAPYGDQNNISAEQWKLIVPSYALLAFGCESEAHRQRIFDVVMDGQNGEWELGYKPGFVEGRKFIESGGLTSPQTDDNALARCLLALR